MVMWTQKARAWDLRKGAETKDPECLKLSEMWTRKTTHMPMKTSLSQLEVRKSHHKSITTGLLLQLQLMLPDTGRPSDDAYKKKKNGLGWKTQSTSQGKPRPS